MARPLIYSQPMTSAERMRRHRAGKKRVASLLASGEWSAADARLVNMPVREYVRAVLRSSERHYYHLMAFQRYKLIKWDDILNGKYGRVGFEFLAEVCEYGDASAQRAVRNRIKKAGAAAGRALWQQLIREADIWELIHKHTQRHNMRMFARETK
jgi:hypothetical protein